MTSRRQQYPRLPRHSLVICATLVENPMNLGGLCRLAEAFRLEALVLRDLALAEAAGFRQLAVNSHRWQPLWPCRPEALPTWLHHQRQRGYSILALACDRAALPLPTAALPQRSVLLLGRELTGIPSPLLPLCDHTLVIPQYGLVDSLNVQTAAAIASYEYLRQWGQRPPPYPENAPSL